MRAANVDEWDLLRALRLAALADAPEAFTSTLERERAMPEDEWRMRAGNSAIAWHGTEPAGIVGCVVIDGRAELVGMWVAPPARRAGTGRALVGWALDRARTLGFDELVLWVAGGNDGAERLYSNCGFELTGVSSAHLRQMARRT